MSTIVENTNPISVEIEPKHSVTSQTGAIVEIIEPDYSVAVQRKEYKVVGDNIYIPRLYDDAPQWMKDLIGTVVDIKTAVAVGNLDDALEALRTLSDELDVAKNTYTLSIVSSNDIDTRINTAIETLNSALLDADATILNIAQTATTPEEASAIAINTLSASLSEDGEIGSFISNMNAAFADLDSATTESINLMESAIEAEFSANATAVQTIRTYVGIDDAGASTGTGLSAYLEGSDGTIGGADSQLINDIRVTAEGVESKFEYNSIININGVYKKSGFGLTTNYTSGTGTEVNPYVSEFWIDASRLKFTNSNMTGQVAPFTIDASGEIPEVTFNGKVAFTNVTGYTAPDVAGDIDANNDLFAQRLGYTNYAAMVAAASSGQTIINGGYVNTTLINANSITANQINTVGLIAENISADEIVGKTITGGVINGARINGAVIKASYLDLNGDLEVLTNYIITVAMYNENPSLYTDAIYISADNQYRIPSLSTVRESTISADISANGSLFKSKIRSYNCANAGHNLKCVKNTSEFTVSTDTLFATITSATGYVDGRTRKSSTLTIKFAGTNIGTIHFNQYSNSGGADNTSSGTERIDVYVNNSIAYTYLDNWTSGYISDDPLVYPNAYIRVTISGINFRIKITQFNSISVYLENGTYSFPVSFTSTTSSLFEVSTIAYPHNETWKISSVSGYYNSSISINNMI